MNNNNKTQTERGAKRPSWKPLNYSCPPDIYEWLESRTKYMKKSAIITLALRNLMATWEQD